MCRALPEEQEAAVERLERFELNYSLLYVSTFHYSTVSVLSFLSKIFQILLFFARRLDILLHTEFMEVEKEDDFRFDGHERSKDRLTWRAECGCKRSTRKPLIN